MRVPSAALSRRRFLGLAAGTAAALTLPGCGSEPAAPAATQAGAGATPPLAEPMTISMCVYARNHASSPLYWQRFAPEGMTVDVKVISSAGEILQSFENGSLDFGLMGAFSVLQAGDVASSGAKVIGMIAREGVGLVGRQGVVEAVPDMKGRRVAVPPPGTQVLILNELLEREGLVLGRDVEAVPLGYADHPAALARGDVDAYIGTEPLATQSVVDGVGVRLPEVYSTPLGDLNTANFASARMLERPEICRAVALMQKQAAEHLTPGDENDPEVWRELLVSQFGYDEAIYEGVLENVGAVWRFDEERVAQFRGAGDALLAQGALPGQPDYEAIFAREYWDV